MNGVRAATAIGGGGARSIAPGALPMTVRRSESAAIGRAMANGRCGGGRHRIGAAGGNSPRRRGRRAACTCRRAAPPSRATAGGRLRGALLDPATRLARDFPEVSVAARKRWVREFAALDAVVWAFAAAGARRRDEPTFRAIPAERFRVR